MTRLACVLAFFGLIVATDPALAQPKGKGPTPSVTVSVVKLQDISQSNNFIGRVEAIEAVDLRARVEGFIIEKSFDEGQDVEAGELIFQIEPDEYEADVKAANAQLLRAKASLREAERALIRAQELFRSDNISEAQVDEARASRDSALGDVRSAEASLRIAELNLSYTRITSPIKGRIGRAAFTKGNLVGPDSGPLARVVQLDPIRVVFSVSDRELLEAKEALNVESLSALEKKFVPSLRLPTGKTYEFDGVIEFTDNEINPDTGTISIFARFENPNDILLPGELVTVVARLEETRRMPVVPQAAVQQDRDGRFVLVVDEDSRVIERRIEVSQQIRTQWAVESGLQEGELVIFQGIQKVGPGDLVNPVFAEERAG